MPTVNFEGQSYEFPDDATDQEISSSLAAHDRETKFNKFKEMLSKSPGNIASQGAKEFAGGLLNSAVGTGKWAANMAKGQIPGSALAGIGNLIPENLKNKIPNNPLAGFDPYKAVGTEEKNFYTPGGAVQLAGELITPGQVVGKGLKKGAELVEKISPSLASKDLLQHLGKGLENTQQATESLVKDIQHAHDVREAQATTHLDYPLKQAGQETIYEHVDPLITTKMDKSKSLIARLKDLKVGDLFDTFKEKPTFENAHNLQSELGTLIGDIKKNPGLSIAEKAELGNLRSVRNNLKVHIKEFLERRDASSNESLAPQYQQGVDLYRENVAPYLSSQKLRQIVRERRTSVPNVHKIFESPYDLAEKLTGKTKPGPISKILSHLSPETKDKILFRTIGANRYAEKPATLANKVKNAEQSGFSHLINRDVKDKVAAIEGRSRNKNIAKEALKWSIPTIGGVGLIEELLRRNISRPTG